MIWKSEKRVKPSSFPLLAALISLLSYAGTCVQICAQPAANTAVVMNYIRQYHNIAIREMMVYRIPASITLAQGIHESNSGQSKLAQLANNHFGIKCHKDWQGQTYYQDDDLPNECFRKYDNAVESFRDHSYFLTLRDRYKGLFELDVNDYRGWARGLQAAGYATNPQYAEKLIQTIERFSLFQFDNANFATAFGDSLQDLDDPARQAWLRQFVVLKRGPGGRFIFDNNRLDMTIARRTDNIYLIAEDFDISVTALMKYNDLAHATALQPGQIVYLESKRRKAAAEQHIVRQGETIYAISQLYGIKLKMLYKRNGMAEGVEPWPGMVLQLR